MRLSHKRARQWLSKHANQQGPSKRALVQDGTIYDPDRLQEVNRFVTPDLRLDCYYRAPDGKIVRDRKFLSPLEYPTGYAKLALAGLGYGTLAAPFILGAFSLAMTTLPWTGYVYILGIMLGISTFLTPAITALFSKAQTLFGGHVYDQSSKIPELTLSSLRAIEGYKSKDLELVQDRTPPLFPFRLRTYQTPDGRFVHSFESRLFWTFSLVSIKSAEEFKEYLLDRKKYKLYRQHFGALPYPSSDDHPQLPS